MSLLSIFDIAGSGMSAQNVRLNTIASNMANASSVASTPDQAYKSRQPVFAAVMEDQMKPASATSATGVRVMGIVESQAEHTSRYEPNHPLANEEGYIYQSNVDVIEEMTNMMVAARNYQNNIEMLNTSKELLLRTLSLGE